MAKNSGRGKIFGRLLNRLTDIQQAANLRV
jgi:hypothetical protein